MVFFFFFSSRRRHTRCLSEWSSDVCSSDLLMAVLQVRMAVKRRAAEIGTTGTSAQADDPRSLRYASKIATQRLIDYTRSEERRVGKECRSRWWRGVEEKKSGDARKKAE